MTEYPFLLRDVTMLYRFRKNIFAAKVVRGQRASPAMPTAPKAVLKFISLALAGLLQAWTSYRGVGQTHQRESVENSENDKLRINLIERIENSGFA